MAHNHTRLFYHFVWATWERTPLLVGDVEARTYALMRGQCAAMNVEVHALGGVEDHVHFLVKLPCTLSISDFVKAVKSVSSRTLNQVFGRPAWSFKWQGYYGVHTVSPSHLPLITAYVEKQKRHHAEGTLWPSSERAEEHD